MDRKDIANYLWNKSPSHLKDNQIKEEKDSYKLIEIWSGRGYEIREAMKSLRLNRFPQTSSVEALYLIAKEKGIEKFDFETEEEFRQRVINALDWHRLKGTVKGIKTILKIYGFKNVKIEPALKYNPQDWAEFNVIIQDILNEKEIKDVIKLINLMKPSHEKLSNLTDGKCKKLGITNITYLNKVLFNTGEGKEIEGVKVCFKYAEEVKNNIELTNKIYTSSRYKTRIYSIYPFIEGFNCSRFNTQIRKIFSIEAKGRLSFYANLKTKTYQEIYKSTYSSMNLAKFNEGANCIDRWEVVKSKYFNKTFLNKKPNILKDVSRRIKRKNKEIKTNIAVDISSISSSVSRKYNYKNLNISIEEGKRLTSLTSGYLKLKGVWIGRWKGKWTKDYKPYSTIEVN